MPPAASNRRAALALVIGTLSPNGRVMSGWCDERSAGQQNQRPFRRWLQPATDLRGEGNPPACPGAPVSGHQWPTVMHAWQANWLAADHESHSRLSQASPCIRQQNSNELGRPSCAASRRNGRGQMLASSCRQADGNTNRQPSSAQRLQLRSARPHPCGER